MAKAGNFLHKAIFIFLLYMTDMLYDSNCLIFVDELENIMAEFNPNPPIVIYFVFKSAEANVVDFLESEFREAGFKIERYDKLTAFAENFKQLFQGWAITSTFIVFIVSQAWDVLSPPMQKEIKAIEAHLDKMKVTKEKASFVLQIEDLIPHSPAYDIACDFGVPKSISNENAHEVASQLINHFNNVRKKRLEKASNKNATMGVTQPLPKEMKFTLKDKVARIWRTNPFSFVETDSIATLAYSQDSFHIRHFPVTDHKDNNKPRLLRGILSYRDILRFTPITDEATEWLRKNIPNYGARILPTLRLYRKWAENLRVRDIYHPINDSSTMITTSEDDMILDAARELQKRHYLANQDKPRYVSILLGITERKLLKGIISYIDILKQVDIPAKLRVEDCYRSVDNFDIRTAEKVTTIEQARQTMGDYRDLPIVDANNVVLGMFSEFELLHNTLPMSELADHLPNLLEVPCNLIPVGDIMKNADDLIQIHPQDPIQKVIDLFISYRTIGGIAVVDEQNKLRGIISYIDILRKLLEG